MLYRRERRIEILSVLYAVKTRHDHITWYLIAPHLELSACSHGHQIVGTYKCIRETFFRIDHFIDKISSVSVGPPSKSDIFIGQSEPVCFKHFPGHVKPGYAVDMIWITADKENPFHSMLLDEM